MAPDVLIHGDTHKSAALRHELPLGILDPFSYFEVAGRRVVVIAVMEADRIQEAAPGVEILDPDELEFIRRRRSKNASEIEGVRRAQAAADAGMAAAAELLRSADPRDGVLVSDGEALTSEAVRARIREVCAELGAPTDEDIIVAAGPAGASGHEQGSGPLPAGVPVIVDIWPRDERSGCFSDMTRTFVTGGEPAEDVAGWHALAETALERVYERVKP